MGTNYLNFQLWGVGCWQYWFFGYVLLALVTSCVSNEHASFMHRNPDSRRWTFICLTHVYSGNIHVPFGFEKTFSRETFLQLQILLQFSPSFWIDGLTSFVVARKKQARELRKRKRIPGGGVALRNSPNSLCDPSFWLSFAAQLTDHMWTANFLPFDRGTVTVSFSASS